jgi:hypothetical protein
MKFATKFALVISAAFVLAASLAAQQRDPLSGVESDQLREVAQDPEKRLKLFIKFADARLDTVEATLQNDKAKGRGQRAHDALQDFRELVDELDDNIDDYVEKQSDLRKVLGEVIGAEEGFEKRLKALQSRASDPKLAEESKTYSFVLQDAVEAVSLSLDDAKKTLDEQNGSAAKK